MMSNTLTAIQNRLNSDDLSVAYGATIELFAKAADGNGLIHAKAQAVTIVDAMPGKSRNQWVAEYTAAAAKLGKRVAGLSPAVMSALANGYKLPTAIGVPVDDDTVAAAVNIYNNGKASLIAEFIDYVNTGDRSVTERLELLFGYAANAAKAAGRNPWTVVAETEDETDVDSEETVDAETGNGFAGQLAVLQTLAARIARGDFDAAESIQLAAAARDILVNAEQYVAATTGHNVRIAA
jgi:hypothetical protein